MSPDASAADGGFRRFFSNPVVGVVGAVASVVGLALAVVFFLASRREPDLVYSVHPIRTTLAHANRPGDLSISYRSEVIRDADVVAVTLAVWNQGGESIRERNVLEPILIEFSPPVRVLEAKATKASRQLVRFDLVSDPVVFAQGRVPLTWSILEQGDGANIQVIFVGDAEARVPLSGVIERQGLPREIRAFSLSKSPRSPSRDYSRLRRERWLFPGSFLLLPAIFGLLILLRIRGPEKMRAIARRVPFPAGIPPLTAFMMFAALYLGAAICLFYGMSRWLPPFGF